MQSVATAGKAGPDYRQGAFRATGESQRFWASHLWWPLTAALATSGLLAAFHVDYWVADRLFAAQGHAWRLMFHPLTEGLLHRGGRNASAVLWLLVVAALVASCVDDRLAHWRKPLVYLAAMSVLAALLVAALKLVSGVDCPWDLARYGGGRVFVGMFEPRPTTMPAASCFPAGQASAGYAWVTLYFFFRVTRPQLRWIGLAFALAAGAVLGFGQQLRGAHFVSHDLWTLVICWLVALASYRLFFGADRRPLRKGGGALSNLSGASQ